VKDGQEMEWQRAAVTFLKRGLHHFAAGTEENYEVP
jgi:hypothetical protein